MKKSKLCSLAAIACLTVAVGCGPKDEKVNNPFYVSDEQVEQDFNTLFPEHEEFSFQAGLYGSDRIVEAARLLEFSLNAEFEKSNYDKEVESDAGGRRGRSWILCRKIKKFERNSGLKKFVIDWDGCKDSRSSKRVDSEVRGQEIFDIDTKTLASGLEIASYIEGTTSPGFEIRLSPKDSDGRSMRGSRGEIRESRNVMYKLVDEEKLIYEFTYRNLGIHSTTMSPVRYEGYDEGGEIQSVIQGKFQVKKLDSGKLIVENFLQEDKDTLDVTFKATRTDIAGKAESKFYIFLTSLKLKEKQAPINLPGKTGTIMVANGTNPDGTPRYEEKKIKFCGAMKSNFEVRTRWLTGIPRSRNNSFTNSLSFDEDEISLNEMTRKGELKPNGVTRKKGCHRPSDIAPLVNRDKFYFR